MAVVHRQHDKRVRSYLSPPPAWKYHCASTQTGVPPRTHPLPRQNSGSKTWPGSSNLPRTVRYAILPPPPPSTAPLTNARALPLFISESNQRAGRTTASVRTGKFQGQPRLSDFRCDRPHRRKSPTASCSYATPILHAPSSRRYNSPRRRSAPPAQASPVKCSVTEAEPRPHSRSYAGA